MDQSKHTPAPWQFCEVMGKINAAGVRIADIPDYREGDELCTQEQKAKGRLMASAPDLLAALITAQWMLERDRIDDQKMAVIDKCRAAIAKAKGE